MVSNLKALFALTTILIIFVSSTSQHAFSFDNQQLNKRENRHDKHKTGNEYSTQSDFNQKFNKYLRIKRSFYDQKVELPYVPNTKYQQNFNQFEDDQFARSQFVHFTPLEPQFDDNIDKNLTVPVGSAAYLQCKIKHLGDRMVSWVRQRDLQILTFSNVTYTSDQRFRCIHVKNTDDWTLELQSVLKSDAGTYECQISTETKLSSKVYLNVIDVQASILEGDTVQVRKDGTINLNCLINYSTNSSNSLILWYHNSNLLNYNKDVLTKSKLLFNKDTSSFYLHSNLRINQVDTSFSGNYTCKFHTTSNVNFIISSSPVNVHVLEYGENPAAIHDIQQNKHRSALHDELGSLIDNSSSHFNPLCIITLNFIIYLFISLKFLKI